MLYRVKNIICVAAILVASSFIASFTVIPQVSKVSAYQLPKFSLPFTLLNPDEVVQLPKKLNEISGLAFYKKNKFFTVNDEQAKLYTYNIDKRKIVNTIDFGKNDDYEALTRNDNLVYIAKSSGNIKVIDIQKKDKVDEFETPLTDRNDVEGLCYDKKNNQLLIACKGELLNNKIKSKNRGIYTFNLANKTFNTIPFKLIDLKTERKKLKRINKANNFLTRWNFNARCNDFAPSGLAIDPITGHIYVIANSGKILLVINESKTIQGIYFLDSKIYGQPEGIAFDAKGNLFVSNELNSKKANILKFLRK